MITNLSEYSVVDKADLGLGGILYPADMVIEARPATVKEIRHWANINDDDQLDIHRHIVDIITSCVRVTSTDDNKKYSPKDLYEFDQLALLLIINSLTFADLKDHTIAVKGKCSKSTCGKVFDPLVVQPSNIVYKDINDKFKKYIDQDNGGFKIATKSYGDIIVKPATIGVALAVQEWMKTFDLQFIRDNMHMFQLVQMLCDDWRTANNKTLRLLQVEQYNQMNPNKLSLYTTIMEGTTVAPEPYLEYTCPDCGERFRCPIQFEGGYRSMFLPVQDLNNELL